jgi:hypothetical protein
MASSRSISEANVGPPMTSARFCGICCIQYVHAARDDRSGHCARICDCSASSSGGRMAGRTGLAQAAVVPEPLTERNSSTSCDRAAFQVGCRLSLGCACAHAANAASMPSSASSSR